MPIYFERSGWLQHCIDRHDVQREIGDRQIGNVCAGECVGEGIGCKQIEIPFQRV